MLQTKELEEKLLKQKREAEEADAERRAKKSGLPYLNLISSKVSAEIKALELIKQDEAEKASVVPLQILRKKKIILAVFDSAKKETQEIIEQLKKNYEVQVFVVSLTSLKYAWESYKYVAAPKEITGKVEINEEHLKKLRGSIKTLNDLNLTIKNFGSPYTSQILETILAGALALDASDIHLEPKERFAVLRLRIDGVLHNAYEEFALFSYSSVVSRIKLLSGLKLNIKNEPQDGRFTINLKERDIEIRTSIIPSEYGETVVMRILDPLSLKTDLKTLGLREDDLQIALGEIAEPNGLILNTGPTGSGKTTTLYAFLRSISSPEIKIITIEDPIEYHLPGISQTQVDPDANYTFANGLRSIMRQDPDVILVGEIRDKETAEIALNASLTGHLVFSTLHTNDAVGAIPRLIDLGVKTQTLGPALSLIIAQRLVRLLCPNCKQAKKISESLNKKIADFISKLPDRIDKKQFRDIKIFEQKGCDKCGGLGYKGRTSIFEFLQVTDLIEETIYKNPTEIELKNLAKEQGMVTIQEDGVLKILSGLTSVAEVEKVTGPIEWLAP